MKKVLTLAAIAASAIIAQAQQTIDLFNGKDLSNWKFCVENTDTLKPQEVFTVKEGLIHIKGKPFGYMYTTDTFENFRLHVEWCYPIERTNSGIFLFVQDPAKVWPNAIECQLCKEKAGDFVLLGGSDVAEFKLPAGKERPKFPVVKKFNDSNENSVGEWNCADIICQNGTITVFINGTLQNIGTNSMHKKGHIALQSEGGDILFRNVRLTPIK